MVSRGPDILFPELLQLQPLKLTPAKTIGTKINVLKVLNLILTKGLMKIVCSNNIFTVTYFLLASDILYSGFYSLYV